MDSNNNLILIRNEDKTEQIEHCRVNQDKWEIKFYNSSKIYTYDKRNVACFRDPRIIDHSSCIVYEGTQPITDIGCIQDFGSYIRISSSRGYKQLFRNRDIRIEQSSTNNPHSSHVMTYFKTIANHVSVKLDGDSSFLSKQFQKLLFVSPRSVLAAYLEKKPLQRDHSKAQIIFPFGFNQSQKAATENALIEQISVIEGPPGTGKTQTILNIIANAVINNKTVAVVSNNNSATANVLEKLQKYDLDFIASYLGNKENKEKFFAEQSGLYPNMADWFLDDLTYKATLLKLGEQQEKLNKMLIFKNQLAKLKQELSELQLEANYYDDYYQTSNFHKLAKNSFSQLRSEKLLTFLIEYKEAIQQGKITFSHKLRNFFLYKIYNFQIYKWSSEELISFLQKLYYEVKSNELQERINELENKLDDYNFDFAMKTYSEDSMRLFKASLVRRYGTGGNRKVFPSNVLWKEFESFSKEYPVILSTTHSLRSSAAEHYLFDYVLVDEASQVDVVTGALALSCAKHAVIVGDTKQLPNVVPAPIKEVTTRIFESYKLDEAYSYAKHSLLTSIVCLYQDVPRTLLKEHYRCHPKIIGFCNQKFYHNELVVLTEESEHDSPILLYKTAMGNHARGNFNQRQIDVVINEILPKQKINPEGKSIGIITPYRMQADEFHKLIDISIEADTVHKFQGREKNIIILSTVANEVKVDDFVDDANLINVAVSRAVDQLIVVVAEGSEEWQGTNIGDLVKYINYHNFEIIESEIYSVFDLLYHNYSEKLQEIRKKSKKVSEYASENLMNVVIDKVLHQEHFSSLDHVLHVPLRMLIRDTGKLTAEERKYAMNILTHTDFVIFNRLDKKPVLIVEVDGHAYHANNPKQLERDRMKDQILSKYGIPIIRMNTTGSGEETKLRQKLLEIMKIE